MTNIYDIFDQEEVETLDEQLDPFNTRGINSDKENQLNVSLDDLDEYQKAIVINTDGHEATYANAGSGKTSSLIARVHYLIEEQKVHPSNILLITFSKRGTYVMKSRCTYEDVKICTIHSLCYQMLDGILKDYFPRLNKRPYLITEGQQRYIIRKNFPYHSPSDVLSRISYVKNAYRKDTSGNITSGEEEFDELLSVYEEEKTKLRRVDYADLCIYAVEILKQDLDFRNFHRNQFKYILVDESQDLVPLLYQVVFLLSNQNVYFTGSAPQTIYSFSGVNDRIFPNLDKVYPDLRKSFLLNNYRSGNKIVRLANTITEVMGLPNTKPMIPKSGIDGVITYEGHFASLAEEATHMVNLLQQNIEEEVSVLEPLSEEAKDVHVILPSASDYEMSMILTRCRWQFMCIELALHKRGIPYHITGGQGFFQCNEVQDIIGWLKVANDDPEGFLRVWYKPNRYLSKKWFQQYQARLEEQKKAYQKSNQNPDLKPSFVSLLQETYNGSYQEKGRWWKIQRDLINTYCILKSMKQAEDVHGMISFIRQDIGYEEWLTNNYALDGSANTGTNTGSNTNTNTDLTYILDQFHALTIDMNYEQVMAFQSGVKPDQKGVKLSTIHGAKGDEAEHVYILGVTQGILPHIKNDNKREEHRLWYVAVTRAIQRLHVSSVSYEMFIEPSEYISYLLEG